MYRQSTDTAPNNTPGDFPVFSGVLGSANSFRASHFSRHLKFIHLKIGLVISEVADLFKKNTKFTRNRESWYSNYSETLVEAR